MGGSAFTQHVPPLSTPRMPRHVYSLVLGQTLSLLNRYFKYAVSPIEAPGKETFGDIDILINQPLQPAFDDTKTSREGVAEKLNSILNAKAHMVKKGEPVVIFAISWPQEHTEEQSKCEEKFFQVDIETCPSHQEFLYSCFFKSHGDLWSILSSTIRPYGLKITNKGLFLCNTRIEPHHKKKSMIFLTSDPVKILGFLGLDVEKYWKKFESLEDLFKYAASCRMFILRKASGRSSDEDVLSSSIFDTELAKLTKKDKARCSKRPMFAAWIKEFIPYCRESGLYLAQGKKLTQRQIRQEAFTQFGVKKIYEDTEHDWLLSRHLDEIWNKAIKHVVPEGIDPSLRASSIRVLREILLDGNPLLNTSDLNLLQKDENGFYDIQMVQEWVKNNWRKAGEIDFARQRAKMEQNEKKVRKHLDTLAISTKT